MAGSLGKSAKHIQIDKANASIVLIVSIAAVLSAFSIVAIKNLLSQRAYQSRVITVQTTALKVAKDDIVAAKKLAISYKAFNGAPSNIIGGLSEGNGPQDGVNSKIVLDALPSQYDFPALVSSIESLVKVRGFTINSLSGVDDAAQAEAATQTAPQPVEMPFQLGVAGSYAGVQDLVSVLDRSVRPISINTLQLTGSDTKISLVIDAKTYYQPGKTLTITKKVVK